MCWIYSAQFGLDSAQLGLDGVLRSIARNGFKRCTGGKVDRNGVGLRADFTAGYSSPRRGIARAKDLPLSMVSDDERGM